MSMSTTCFLSRASSVIKGPFPNLPKGFAESKNINNEMEKIKEEIDKSVYSAAKFFSMSHGGSETNQAEMSRANFRKHCAQHLQDAKEGIEKLESLLKELSEKP